MNATALLDPEDDDEYPDDETREDPNGDTRNSASRDSHTRTGNTQNGATKASGGSRRLRPPSHRRSVTAVDLRRRTSEIIAALERNEELVVSHRDRWICIMRPINRIEGFGYHPPLRRHRYFGYARHSPRLRRSDDPHEVERRALLESHSKGQVGGASGDDGPPDDLMPLFNPPGQIPPTPSRDDE